MTTLTMKNGSTIRFVGEHDGEEFTSLGMTEVVHMKQKETVEVVKRFLMSTPTGALISNGKLHELAASIVEKLSQYVATGEGNLYLDDIADMFRED